MIIKEIELNNFRIYKGVNNIDLTTKGKKNSDDHNNADIFHIVPPMFSLVVRLSHII